MLVHVRDRHPVTSLLNFERDLDRIVRGAFGFGAPVAAGTAFSVTPDAEGVTVRAELPGIDPAAIRLAVDNRVLTIAAERGDAARSGGAWHLRERASGTFHHSLRLSDELDADGISAECRNGILTVRVPKRADVKPRQIEVKVG